MISTNLFVLSLFFEKPKPNKTILHNVKLTFTGRAIVVLIVAESQSAGSVETEDANIVEQAM
jgi:hypothetical protein